ncbi:MAG: polyprenyl synthetase family protein [Lachnospiraceae bacterium]|nr:polyprenyl synthetase family protein [Lachnospiraceae bacterium]
MNFKDTLQEKVKETEQIIFAYLPKEEGYQRIVMEAMNYSFQAGGKRLRPILMKEVYSLFGGNTSVIEPFMAAQEMIHTYSLVHDDLPAMDNDEYRRGRKTTHVVYGDGMAVLTGDALLNYAFETALKAFNYEPTNDRIVTALQVLANKAGIYGMLGGQVVDVEAEKKNLLLSGEELLFIHEKKTGALLQSSMMIGAILAGAEEEQIELVERAACCIGVAFQIQDDILDVEGDERLLGKPVGSDEKNNKSTYVTMNGMEKSKEDVLKLSKEAMDLFGTLPVQNEFLMELIKSLINREK